MKNTASLRRRFLGRMFIVLLLIVLVSGVVQIMMVKNQINKDIHNQGNLISTSILQKIKETDNASDAIEHQIDLKMLSYARFINEQLKGKNIEEISKESLLQLSNAINVAGITLMKRQGDDIVGVQATNENEIGFSFKKIGYIEGYEALDSLMKGEELIEKYNVSTSLIESNQFMSLPIAQSGSHGQEPVFFKYGYYYDKENDYIINPYITANEVNKYIEEVGPQSWIENIVETDQFIEEIAVLNTPVFKDPSLEGRLYPPNKKVEYGTYHLQSDEDVKQFLNIESKVNYVQKVNGKSLYKMFIPIDDNQIVYIALDYKKVSSPLYQHAGLIIGAGILSLVALFLLTARFFNTIYENLKLIKSQINHLESGDLTAKSHIKDRSELQNLSEIANRMVDSLHRVISETKNQAHKVQHLSVMVKEEASQSVEHMFAISTEATLRSREQLNIIMDFLDSLDGYIQTLPSNEKNDAVLNGIEEMRQVAQDRTAATTDMTLSLSDLLNSLHNQSSELAEISNLLLDHMSEFKLSKS